MSASWIESLARMIIRPPRSVYTKSDLGPSDFMFDGVHGTRHDIRLRTPRGLSLECSHFEPRGLLLDYSHQQFRKMPVVVYLHGNASNRLEALKLAIPLLERGIALFCYDSAGCGISEGEFVTLGWHEREDLIAVIAHIRQSPCCGEIGLWGWSMGAVTALLVADIDTEISSIVLDSPFSDLWKLCDDLARENTLGIPFLSSFIASTLLESVNTRVQELASFDIKDMAPVRLLSKTSVPVLFVHAVDDTYIPFSHSQELYDVYTGSKRMLRLPGDHMSERDPKVMVEIIDFLVQHFSLHCEPPEQTQKPQAKSFLATFGTSCCSFLTARPIGRDTKTSGRTPLYASI